MGATELRLLSATRIAALIREGVVTSRQAVEQHIAQVRAVNPVINAVVAERFDTALREADAADARQRTTPRAALPAFHGVPCTVKECFALEGMPNSAGLVARRDVLSTEDATVVARVRAAGAIPLGVTNTSELCMWMESNNYVYGCTNNPYNPDHIVGGSSGGEGAIIAAGASPFGVGSDIGGSIRGPAFFNGVFGHKPTGGLVPGTGQHPLAPEGALRYQTTGPLTRRAEDLMPLLRVMAGPDGKDSGCTPFTLGDPASVDLAGLTVLNVEDNGTINVSRDLRLAQARVVGALAARGARVITRGFPALRKQFDIWSAMLGDVQDVSFGTMLGQGRAINPLFELGKWALRRSDHTAMASVLALIDPLPKLLPKLRKELVAAGHALRAELVEVIGPHGVMLYPTYATPAPRHFVAFRDALRLKLPFAYTGILNVLELPATQVPLGLNAAGLPLGVQVAAVHGNDHVSIAVALELERVFGGWVPPALARIPSAAA